MNDAIPFLALFIPIFAIVGGIALAIIAVQHRHKRAEMEHQERMAAIEKGLPLPKAPEAQTLEAYTAGQVLVPMKRRNPYLWGFILTGAGIALVITNILEGSSEGFRHGVMEDVGFGMVLMFIGLAILAANMLFLRDHKPKVKKLEETGGATSSL